MYTYGMYRLNDSQSEDILARLKAKISHPVDPLPVVEGYQPHLASSKKVFFAAVDAAAIARHMAAVRAFAHAGHQVVLAVPEPLKETATEAWDYLPDGEKSQVRILLMPPAPPVP